MADAPRKLRSSDWFGGAGKNAFMHRSWMKNQGLPGPSLRRPAGHRHLQYLRRNSPPATRISTASPSM